MGENTIQAFELPSVLDIDAMDELRDWLTSALEVGNIRLNGSAVVRVVTNALLLLVSANQSALKNNLTFCVCDPSPALCEAVDRLGLTDIFSDFLEGQ
jgi:anti-anti-sigma regulatory factor